jgi:hypothetical protein
MVNAEARTPNHLCDERDLSFWTPAVDQGLNIREGRVLRRSVHSGHDAKIAAWKRCYDYEPVRRKE